MAIKKRTPDTSRISDHASLTADLMNAMLRTSILNGEIDPRGKTDAELVALFVNWAKNRKSQGFTFTVDHTETFWDLAKKAERQKSLELAALYYAIWAEHQLNSIFIILFARKGYDDWFVHTIIRETGFKSKFLWLHILLRRKPNKSMFEGLVKLFELRNQIIHYKWKPTPDEKDAEDEIILKKAKPSLNFLAKILKDRLLYKSEVQLTKTRDLFNQIFEGVFTKKSLKAIILEASESEKKLASKKQKPQAKK